MQRRFLSTTLAALLGCALAVTVPEPAAAGTSAQCGGPADAVTIVSETTAVFTRTPSGVNVISESRLLGGAEANYSSTLSIGDEQLEIASVVRYVTASVDGSLWITTGGTDPDGNMVDSGIGILRWTEANGIESIPETAEWSVVAVDDNGRALVTNRLLEVYRWISPDGADESIPWPDDEPDSRRYLEFSLHMRLPAQPGGPDAVILGVDGVERDITTDYTRTRSRMAIGPGPVVIKDQSVLVIGIEETLEYPIADPTNSLRLVGRTETGIYLARFGPGEAEVFKLDVATGLVESVGFGPEGSFVTVFNDASIWVWPVIQAPDGDAFRTEVQELSALPYEPSFVSPNERSDQIRRLYLGFFDRLPDDEGLDFWLGSGLEPTAIAAQFARSDEFTNTYGDLDLFQFVQVVYRNVLGREPDLEGTNFWTDQLFSGLPAHEMMLSFTDSPEFIESTETVAPSERLDASLERLYRAYFNRSPDAGGLCFWSTEILIGGRALADVSGSFEQSPEFDALYGSLDNAAFVALVYRNVLGRDADAGGASFWLDALDSDLTRGQLMLQFAESAEFKATTDTV